MSEAVVEALRRQAAVGTVLARVARSGCGAGLGVTRHDGVIVCSFVTNPLDEESAAACIPGRSVVFCEALTPAYARRVGWFLLKAGLKAALRRR